MSENINMSVTQIFRKNNSSYYFVSFTDDKKIAEFRLPELQLTYNLGFDRAQTDALKLYIKREYDRIYEMAKKVNVIENFIKG